MFKRASMYAESFSTVCFASKNRERLSHTIKYKFPELVYEENAKFTKYQLVATTNFCPRW